MRYLPVLVIFLISGCNLTARIPEALPPGSTQPSDPIQPTVTFTPAATLPAEAMDESWQTIAPGLEQRLYTPDNAPLVAMMALRIDPAYYTFRAHYRPGEALTLAEWRTALPEAVAMVNANFFSAEQTINGLLVSDGMAYGTCYTDRGGMFYVQNGIPRVRSLLVEPCVGEALEQAVQAFPMLVLNGQPAGISDRQRQRSRRTIIGQDSAGQIILLATPLLGLGLYDLSAYLPTTDLRLVNAFNLDGGGSTLMWIAPSGYEVVSFDPVPAVLAVYAK